MGPTLEGYLKGFVSLHEQIPQFSVKWRARASRLDVMCQAGHRLLRDQESVAVVSRWSQDTLPPCRCHGSPDLAAPVTEQCVMSLRALKMKAEVPIVNILVPC